MLKPYRGKQTARKSTGGKPPKPRASVVYGSESIEHSPTIQRRAIGRTLQHSDESDYKDKIPLVMAEFGKQDEQQLSHHGSAPELDGFQMWSAPTSYVRGVEEGEETAAVPSASSSINNSTDSLMVIDVPTSQGRPQCTRCSKVKPNTMCEPVPGSKKCAKCYRDHRVCSWAPDVPGSVSSGSRQPSPPKRTAPVSTGGNITSGSEISDIEEELDELDKDEKLSPSRKGAPSPSKNGYPGQINGKCLRCASFSNNPICERSDDLSDLKCKKCRRDKQSCSFAPYGGRRKPVSKAMAEEDGEDGTDGDSEQEAKQSKAKRGISEGARLQENPSTEEQRPDPHSAKGKEKEKPTVVVRAMEKALVNGDERPKEKNVAKADKPQEKGKGREVERPKEKEKSGGIEKREDKAKATKGHIRPLGKPDGGKQGNIKEKEHGKVSEFNETAGVTKRKADAEPGGGHLHLKKLKFRKALVDPKSSVPSSSKSAGGPASSPPKSTSRMIIEQPASAASEVHAGHVKYRTPAPRSSTLGKDSSMPAGAPSTLVQNVVDRDAQERDKSTTSRAPSQHTPMEVDPDRSLALIERELSVAENKASLYRTLAESVLKDAEMADREVAKLKEELLATVRRKTTVEGSVIERRKLIEMLGGRGDA